MPQTKPGWVNPALDPDPSRWRFAPKRKGGWLAPGEQNPKSAQPMVLMPPGFDPRNRDANFQIVVSPPGTAAPPGSITLTPDTGDVYEPGGMNQPPLNLTNLSLVAMPSPPPGLPPMPGEPPPLPPAGPGGPEGPPGGAPPPAPPPTPGLTPPGGGSTGMPPGMPGGGGGPPPPVVPPPAGGAPPPGPGGMALPPMEPPPPGPPGPPGMGQDVGQGEDVGDPQDPILQSPIAQQARALWLKMGIGTGIVGQPRPQPQAPLVGLGQDVGVGQSPEETARLRAEALRRAAEPWVGTPYSYGGNAATPNPQAPAGIPDWDNRGVDCSALVTGILRGFGMNLPGRPTTNTYVAQATPVEGPPQPGDIMMSRNNDHMALYIGGGQMVEAPDRGQRVRITPVYGGLRPLRLREPVPGLDAATLLSQQAAGMDPTTGGGAPPSSAVSSAAEGTPGGLMSLALRLGADAQMAPIMGAAAMLESRGGNPNAEGDRHPETGRYQSQGLYQMHDQGLGKGISDENRRNPEFATRYMLQQAFEPARRGGQALGLQGEDLAAYTYMAAEQPFGWPSRNPTPEARRASINSEAANAFRTQYRQMSQMAQQGQDIAIGGNRAVVPLSATGASGTPATPPRPPVSEDAWSRAQAILSSIGEATGIIPRTAYAEGETPDMGRTVVAPPPSSYPPPTGGITDPGQFLSNTTRAPEHPAAPPPAAPGVNLAPVVNTLGGVASDLGDMANAAGTNLSNVVPQAAPAPGPTEAGVPSINPATGRPVPSTAQTPAPPPATAQPSIYSTGRPVPPSVQAQYPPGTPGTAPGAYTPPLGPPPPVPPPSARDTEGRTRPSPVPNRPRTAEEMQASARYEQALTQLRTLGVPQEALDAIGSATPDVQWELIEQYRKGALEGKMPHTVTTPEGIMYSVSPDGTAVVVPNSARPEIRSVQAGEGLHIVQEPGKPPVMYRGTPDGGLYSVNPETREETQIAAPRLTLQQQATNAAEAARNATQQQANANQRYATDVNAATQTANARLPYEMDPVQAANDRLQKESEFARQLKQRQDERATVSAEALLQAQNAIDVVNARIAGDIQVRGTASQDNLDNLAQAKELYNTLSAKDKADQAYNQDLLQLNRDKFERPYREPTAQETEANKIAREASQTTRDVAELPYKGMTKAQEADAQIARERLGIDQQKLGLDTQRLGLDTMKAQSDIEFRNRPDALQLEHGGVGLIDRRTGQFSMARGEQPYSAEGNLMIPAGSQATVHYMPGAATGDLRTVPVTVGSPGIGMAGMPGYGGGGGLPGGGMGGGGMPAMGGGLGGYGGMQQPPMQPLQPMQQQRPMGTGWGGMQPQQGGWPQLGMGQDVGHGEDGIRSPWEGERMLPLLGTFADAQAPMQYERTPSDYDPTWGMGPYGGRWDTPNAPTPDPSQESGARPYGSRDLGTWDPVRNTLDMFRGRPDYGGPEGFWDLPDEEQYRRIWETQRFGTGQDSSGRTGRRGSAGWVDPIDRRQVVGTGHRWGEAVDLEGTHHGVDLQAVRGTPVRSPESGWVSNVSYNPKGLGLQVEVQDPKGWRQQLSHLDQANVQVGDRVGAGQQVGQVGSTGASTGPHLDVRTLNPQGQRVDPTGWLGPLAHLPRADKAPVGSGESPFSARGATGHRLPNDVWEYEPIPDTGTMRLYRGNPIGWKGGSAGWDPESKRGRWFIDNPQTAVSNYALGPEANSIDATTMQAHYGRDADGKLIKIPGPHSDYRGGVMHYVDVPADVARQSLHEALPHGRGREFVLPAELAARMKPMFMGAANPLMMLGQAVQEWQHRDDQPEPGAMKPGGSNGVRWYNSPFGAIPTIDELMGLQTGEGQDVGAGQGLEPGHLLEDLYRLLPPATRSAIQSMVPQQAEDYLTYGDPPNRWYGSATLPTTEELAHYGVTGDYPARFRGHPDLRADPHSRAIPDPQPIGTVPELPPDRTVEGPRSPLQNLTVEVVDAKQAGTTAEELAGLTADYLDEAAEQRRNGPPPEPPRPKPPAPTIADGPRQRLDQPRIGPRGQLTWYDRPLREFPNTMGPQNRGLPDLGQQTVKWWLKQATEYLDNLGVRPTEPGGPYKVVVPHPEGDREPSMYWVYNNKDGEMVAHAHLSDYSKGINPHNPDLPYAVNTMGASAEHGLLGYLGGTRIGKAIRDELGADNIDPGSTTKYSTNMANKFLTPSRKGAWMQFSNPLLMLGQAFAEWQHRHDPAPDSSQLTGESAAPVASTSLGLLPMGSYDTLPRTGWQGTPYLGDY